MEIRESHVPVFKSGGNHEKGTRPNKRGEDTAATASSFFVGGGKDCKRKCVFCLKEHAPEECSNVKDITERESILIKYARCFVCLNSKHRAFECRHKVPCKICKGNHHVSICVGPNPANKETPSGQQPQPEPSAQTLNVNAASWVGRTGSGDRVALQTALAKVNAKKESKVRVLFDTGSHKSFISAKAVSKLGVRPIRSERLGILPFGSREAEFSMREIVQISLHSLCGEKSVNLECYVVDEIADISNSHVEIAKKHYPHLHEIWFSDVSRSEDTLCVDILIGSDTLWEFHEGEAKRGGPGEPVAVKRSWDGCCLDHSR